MHWLVFNILILELAMLIKNCPSEELLIRYGTNININLVPRMILNLRILIQYKCINESIISLLTSLIKKNDWRRINCTHINKFVSESMIKVDVCLIMLCM